jgi:subtilisin family serine protease
MNTLLRPGRISLLGLLALALILPGVAMAQSPGTGASNDEQPTIKPRADEQFVEGQIIVKFRPSANPPEEAAIRRQEGLAKKEDLGLIDAEVDKIQGQSVEQAVRALEGRPNVEYAEPDFIARATGYADEPRFGELWGLNNTGQNGGTPNVDINGLEASAVTQGDPNLVVAVLDSGADFSHPDLAGHQWVNPGESGGGKETNGIDDDGDGFVDDVNGADFVNNDGNPFDDHGHGTHVSGTIAASVNGKGVVGVAPNVKIMALKFCDASARGSTSNLIKAITYAKNKGAKISNISWGGNFPFLQALKDAIDASGSLVVAAAGNGEPDGIGDDNDVTPFYPASYDSPNILSVAAINNQGNLAFFSNFGATSVDISAPGMNILSSIPGTPAAALSSVGSSGKAITAGYGADEIGDTADRASFFTKSFTAVNRGSQPVVVVDDDGSSNGGEANVGPTLAAAIKSATGSAPTVIDVAAGTNGPALSALTGKTVVWATGQEFDSDGAGTTLTATDQATLTNFLGGGGKLVLTGRDALRNIEASPFVTSTLNLTALSDGFDRTTFAGSSGTAFAGEAYDLNSPTANQPNWHDSLTPRNSSAVTQGLYPGSYAYLDGTSQAAPHVTGVAALAASADPALLSDPVALKNHVMDTGKPVPATSGKTVTGDMVDAEAAVGGVPRRPANDDFANAQSISGASATVNGTDVNATREFGEPDHLPDSSSLGDKTVWYNWTAPSSGQVNLDTCTMDFDTFLAVYTGGSVGGLSQLASNDDSIPCDSGSQLSFTATAGTTYRIAVGGVGGSEGTFTLRIKMDDVTAPKVISTVPPANAKGVAPGANITATFSEAMDPKTVVTTPTDPANPNVGTSTTFKLMKAGTTNQIGAVVTYDPNTKKAILNPNANLRRGTKYKAAVTTGAQDLAGNPLDQDQDPSNGLQQKGWSFTIKN